MAEASSELEGPNFENGNDIDDLTDGMMLLGHAFGEATFRITTSRNAAGGSL
jgi:hypothetical protein